MTIEEFLRCVESEHERTIRRIVWTIPPDVLVKGTRPDGARMNEILSAPRPRAEQHDIRYAHILGAPASEEEIDAWQRLMPSHPMPADLRALVTRVNGIHLWAKVGIGRSYVGIAPIEEWQVARVKMYGSTANQDLLDDRYVAISYHQEGTSFVVVDMESGLYFLMDAAGPDTTAPIATNVDGLLDWLWQSRIAPKG